MAPEDPQVHAVLRRGRDDDDPGGPDRRLVGMRQLWRDHATTISFVFIFVYVTAVAGFAFDASRENDRDIAASAEERRHQIVQAGVNAVRLGCRDTNLARREQRQTILEARPRLRALRMSGDVSAGLYREAIRQGNRRLERLAPQDCDQRAARFRATALTGD